MNTDNRSLKTKFFAWFEQRLGMPRQNPEYNTALKESLHRKVAPMPSTRLMDAVEVETRWPAHLEKLADDIARRSGQDYEVYAENFTRNVDDWVNGLPPRQREAAQKLANKHMDYFPEYGRASQSSDTDLHRGRGFWDRYEELGRQHIEAEPTQERIPEQDRSRDRW